MGYLDQDALDGGSQLELDYFDLHSNHYGAFVSKANGGQELVGVTRLILSRGQELGFSPWIENTVNVSRSLTDILRRSQAKYAAFPLPIFNTLRLDDLLCKAVRSPQAWGELSRVIVAPQWRGRGVSRRLVKYAIDQADELPCDALLLECLDFHKSLYADFGFNFVGQRGEVMGVGKTMTGMVRKRPRSAR
jgi:predicted GNAT family N-acyltransferase